MAMSSGYIPAAMRKRLRAESNHQCAYCRSSEILTGMPLVVDHIKPRALGGKTSVANLCLACHRCNQYKGARSRAVDPFSGKTVMLFNPRQQSWHDHFKWNHEGTQILGLTPCGRATVAALQLNNEELVAGREIWDRLGLHPPLD